MPEKNTPRMQPPAITPVNGIFLLDPDEAFRAAVTAHCATLGLPARCFPAAAPFLAALHTQQPLCIVLEMDLAEGSGLEMQAHLARQGYRIPVIFAAHRGDPALVVQAIRGGAQDFLVKPVTMETLCEQVRAALDHARATGAGETRKKQLRQRLLTLTQREHEVLALALTGKVNKEISRVLDISPRTVEAHRARVLDKMGLNNLLELAHIFVEDSRWPPGPIQGGGDLQ